MVYFKYFLPTIIVLFLFNTLNLRILFCLNVYTFLTQFYLLLSMCKDNKLSNVNCDVNTNLQATLCYPYQNNLLQDCGTPSWFFSKSLKKVPKHDVVKDFTKKYSNMRIYLADAIITYIEPISPKECLRTNDF